MRYFWLKPANTLHFEHWYPGIAATDSSAQLAA